ncbi:hypothetical protein QZH41_015083 [Actinostola sp. cb2023]|nr:hypothetical protein QZH41_015083 [Actinostola sp. cb2023]
MAVFLLEPHAMAISRTPDRLKNGHDNSNDDDYIDYRKLPRSSGDGMEHAGNHAEPSPHSPNSTPSHQANKTPNVHTSEIKYNVNSDLKKLVVAAVGEDLENSLEALLMKNAQSAVEIKHWKMLSEEYAEESDKFAIECDVWRTKFMASRMMSDELCSWKTTLYTKFKQTQSALQRILNEREELKKYLLKTKRLLHVLGDSMQHGGGFYKHGSEASNEGHCVGQQSVLELASVVSCLMQDLTTDMLEDVQGVSVPAKALALTEEAEKQTVEPTPGEKLAIQVLISDVDVELHTAEQPADSTVMTRLGKQYIGNSYHSRLLTNSFRVTYDCCDRCKGPVQVV